METNFHHGKRLRLLSIQKNLSEVDIAKVRGVSKQAINNDFNRENIGLKTINKYCQAIGVSLDDFYKENIKSQSNMSNVNFDIENQKSVFTFDKVFEVMEENRKLWTIIAHNGIKVDLGKSHEVLKKPFVLVPPFFLGIQNQSSARMPYQESV